MTVYRFFCTALALGASACIITGCSKDEPETPPVPLSLEEALPAGEGNGLNVLLITVDTLRADHLGSYGYGPRTSPTIDALAARGTVFENAYAPRGLTWPSLGTLMTSRYPVTHGVRKNAIPMRSSEVMLAEILRAKGYTCEAMIAPNAFEQDWQGFDHLGRADDLNIATEGKNLLKGGDKTPFFMWLHFFGPHRPYNPPKKYVEQFTPGYTGPFDGSIASTNAITMHQKELDKADLDHIIGLYDGAIAWTDELLIRVFEKLDALGLRESTLVVFTSDHGEDLYDHNRYFNHLGSIYDSSLHVPLIFSLPGVVPEGERVSPLVEMMDIAPTILELLGFGAAPTFDGTSLAPLLRGEPLELGPAYGEWEDRILTVRTDRYRYVLNPMEYEPVFIGLTAMIDLKKESFYLKLQEATFLDPGVERLDYPIQEVELYDVQQDPLALVENLGAHSADVKKLNALLVDYQERFGWEFLGGFDTMNVDPGVEERLESLGYVF